MLNLLETELPRTGKQQGVFVDARNTTVTDKKGKTLPALELWVQLLERNSAKERLTVKRRYTLDTRGINLLKEDLKTWWGEDAQPELFRSFDPESLLGNSCLVNISHKQEAGRTVAVFTEFERSKAEIKSEGYTRQSQKKGD